MHTLYTSYKPIKSLKSFLKPKQKRQIIKKIYISGHKTQQPNFFYDTVDLILIKPVWKY